MEVLTPGICECDLFGNRSDIIKLRRGHTELGWVLFNNTVVLRHQGRRTHKDSSRDWSDTATNQGIPEKQEETRFLP